MSEIRTGTMGWSYEDWRGPFYPDALPSAKMLQTYAQVFDTVELDTTFYGAPRPATVAGWAAQVPPAFLFAAKVPRAVTHERRLVGAAEAALDFGRLLRDNLDGRLGGLLLQLPPDFTAEDRPTVDDVLAPRLSPRGEPGLPWVIEFRSATWAETDIAADLEARGVACATTERLDVGATLSYIRLLGAENAFPRFDKPQADRSEEVTQWAARIAQARDRGGAPRILIYIRNFFEGHAPATILALRRRLGLPVPTPPGQQQMSLF